MAVDAMMDERQQHAPRPILEDWSIEITAKDADRLEAAAHLIPPGCQVSITFLPNEDIDSRVRAAELVRTLGFVPLPHIPARRLQSAAELEAFLDRLASRAGAERLFVVAGDLAAPLGPYDDALAVLRSGLLSRYDVRHVAIAGYPEGHPAIATDRLWQAMRDKQAALGEMGMTSSIITQFGFDARPILDWLAQLRAHGVHAPVRIGAAGPTNMKTLLKFAARCGVSASTSVLTKYGISISRLFGSAGPDRLIDDIRRGLDPARHGAVKLHFYPFGGLATTAEWVRAFERAR